MWSPHEAVRTFGSAHKASSPYKFVLTDCGYRMNMTTHQTCQTEDNEKSHTKIYWAATRHIALTPELQTDVDVELNNSERVSVCMHIGCMADEPGDWRRERKVSEFSGAYEGCWVLPQGGGGGGCSHGTTVAQQRTK
jgi:hypothetical protein